MCTHGCYAAAAAAAAADAASGNGGGDDGLGGTGCLTHLQGPKPIFE